MLLQGTSNVTARDDSCGDGQGMRIILGTVVESRWRN